MYGMDQENKVSKIFIVSLSSNGRGGKISIKKIKKICGPNCEIRLAKLTNHDKINDNHKLGYLHVGSSCFHGSPLSNVIICFKFFHILFLPALTPEC